MANLHHSSRNMTASFPTGMQTPFNAPHTASSHTQVLPPDLNTAPIKNPLDLNHKPPFIQFTQLKRLVRLALASKSDAQAIPDRLPIGNGEALNTSVAQDAYHLHSRSLKRKDESEGASPAPACIPLGQAEGIRVLAASSQCSEHVPALPAQPPKRIKLEPESSPAGCASTLPSPTEHYPLNAMSHNSSSHPKTSRLPLFAHTFTFLPTRPSHVARHSVPDRRLRVTPEHKLAHQRLIQSQADRDDLLAILFPVYHPEQDEENSEQDDARTNVGLLDLGNVYLYPSIDGRGGPIITLTRITYAKGKQVQDQVREQTVLQFDELDCSQLASRVDDSNFNVQRWVSAHLALRHPLRSFCPHPSGGPDFCNLRPTYLILFTSFLSTSSGREVMVQRCYHAICLLCLPGACCSDPPT